MPGGQARAIQHQRRDQAGVAQAAQEGRRVPMTVRNRANQPLAPLRAAMRAGHVRRRPSIVETNNARRIERRLQLRPNSARIGYILALLLLGLEVLFLSVRPSRATTFHITA
jgi:hypothetical protein